VIRQLERQRPREVLDGADLFEDLFEPLVEEPLEGFVLDGEQVGRGRISGILANERRSATREAKGASLNTETTGERDGQRDTQRSVCYHAPEKLCKRHKPLPSAW